MSVRAPSKPRRQDRARFAAGTLLLLPSAFACAANGDLGEPGDGNGSGEIG